MGDILLFPGEHEEVESAEESPLVSLWVDELAARIRAFALQAISDQVDVSNVFRQVDEMTRVLNDTLRGVVTLEVLGQSRHVQSDRQLKAWLGDFLSSVESADAAVLKDEDINEMIKVLELIEDHYLPEWLLNDEMTLEELLEQRIRHIAKARSQTPEAFARIHFGRDRQEHIKDILAPLA